MRPNKPPILQHSLVQLIGLGLITAITAALWGSVGAKSTVLGGLIAVIAQLYFSAKVFRYSGAKAAREVAQSFYRGEAGKFVLVAIGFALVFATVRPLSGPAVFIGFVIVTVIQVLQAWRFNRPA